MANRIKVEPKELAPLTGRPWTRHYDPGIPATLRYPDVPLQALLDDAAESYPNATATIFFNAKRTYRSISEDAWRFANGLRRVGVKKGDRVALVLPNTPQFVVAFYGALRAGAVLVCCNPRYTAAELQHQLADAGATVVVVLSRLYPLVNAARPGTAVERVIVTNIKEEMPPVLRLLFTVAKEKKDGHRQPFAGDAGALAFRQVLAARAEAMILELQLELEDLLKDIQRHRPRMFSGAPIIYNAINNSPLTKKYDLRSIEACVSGSAPLLNETHRRFVELTGAKLVEGYGLTEAAPVTHCNPLFGEGEQKVGSIGVPFPDVEAKIVDLDAGEREMAIGEPGELILRGPQLMDGYYHQPEETAQALRGGWLYTGDIATVDADGYFAIVDRKKEMIIVSGFKVYPRDVEEVLVAHPAVTAAAAIGIPHPNKGEEVKAFVVLKPGATATADEIIAHCRKTLADFKVPRQLEFRASLPHTLIGKTLRKELAAEEKAKRTTAVPA